MATAAEASPAPYRTMATAAEASLAPYRAMAKLNASMNSPFDAMVAHQADLMKSFPGLSAIEEAVRQQAEIVDLMARTSAMDSVVDSASAVLGTQAIEASLRLYEGVRAAMATFIASLPEPSERVRLMSYLAERGWYPSPQEDAQAPPWLIERMDAGDHESIENHMVAFARERIDDIAEVVSERWPARAGIVQDALIAHSSGKYSLSVPVFLAQADGISQELLGYSLFGTQYGKPQTGPRVLAMLGEDDDWVPRWGDMFLAPLISGSSMMVKTTERDSRRGTDPTYGPLNRHGVLHGLDLDYGTEGNSLRAAMVLDYLSWVADQMARIQEAA